MLGYAGKGENGRMQSLPGILESNISADTFTDSFGNQWAFCTNCILCREDKPMVVYQLPGDLFPLRTNVSRQILLCKNCRLAWSNPRILSALPANERKRCTDPVSAQRSTRHSQSLKLIAEYHHRGKILDFGCGFGALLEEARGNGYQVCGIDIGARQVEYLQEKLGIKAYRSFKDAGFEPKSFDAVAMEAVLEHLLEPFSPLCEIHRILRDDGVLLVTVPDIDSIKARLFRSQWNMFHVLTHRYFYSLYSLSLLLERCGFSIVRRELWMEGGGTLRNYVKWTLAELGIATSTQLVVVARPSSGDESGIKGEHQTGH